MLKLRSKIIVLLVISSVCTQCSFFNKKNIEVDIKRFDNDFYSTDTTDFAVSLELLASDYPDFYPVFVEGVLGIADNYQNFPSYINQLGSFRTHPSMLGLFDTIQFHYPNLNYLEKEFEDAFAEFYKHFKDADDMEVVTFISEFGNKAILYEGGIGVSLDMFLGEQYPYYKGLQFPNYIIKQLNENQILPNAMRVLAEDYVTALPQDATFLDAMILEGKRLYFAEKMLPNTAKHQIIEYTSDQYNWCLQHEFNIWGTFIDSDLLYNTKFTQYRRYIEEGPSTMGMPSESPGKIGVWIGWQIVKKFMDQNRGVALRELMEMNDAQLLLTKSKYKPKL